MESWYKSQRVWMRAMSFHAKNMGWIGQIQSFVTGKWIITCVFMHPKKNRNNMKIQISFCGGVWSRICPQCEDSGQSRRSCCIAKWCISCKNNAPPTSGRVRGAFRVSGWAVCQRAESFWSTWRFLIYKEGRQGCLTGLHSSGIRRRIPRETAGNPGCTAWLRPCNLLLRKCRRKVVAFFRSIR